MFLHNMYKHFSVSTIFILKSNSFVVNLFLRILNWIYQFIHIFVCLHDFICTYLSGYHHHLEYFAI